MFDGPCVVCGESVKGRNYVALGLYGVFSDEGDGIFFKPDESPCDVVEWSDIAMTRVVHLDHCAATYFEGVLSDLAHRRRTEST